MSHDPKRERAFGLLSELCGGGEFPTEALRTASHTLFDVAQHAGPETLYAVSEALPWMAAFVSLSSGDSTHQEISNELYSRGALCAMPPSALNRRLREAVQGTLRAPSIAVDGPIAQTLCDAAKLDRRLTSVIFRSDDDVRSEILDDAKLLSAALEVCENDAALESEARRRLAGLFPLWAERDVRPRSRALRVLEGLESSWDGGVVARVSGFSERSRRFELSSVDHLRQNGFLETVRAAMAFAPVETNMKARGEMERRAATGRVEPGLLRQFPAFRDDSALESLALALVQMRGRTIAFLRGSLPFAGLSPWVDFLRGPCVDLAESRDITLREATSFAHFALHLMNFCDLVAFHRGAATDDVRRALMEVEDELKEFALAYQREGLHDGASDLARFDDARWRSAEPTAWLADRLARLRGCWREGSTATPIGAPPQVNPAEHERFTAVIDRLDEDSPFSGGLTNLLKTARIEGVRWLETLEADDLLSVLALGARAARDMPAVDTDREWVLDPSGLADWATSDAPALRAGVLSELLARHSPGDLLSETSSTNSGQRDRGIVTELTRGDTPTVRVNFTPDAELEAMLTLLGSAQDDHALRTVLNARLDEMLAATHAEDNTQELVLSEEARHELGL